jgi:hypothetical protein
MLRLYASEIEYNQKCSPAAVIPLENVELNEIDPYNSIFTVSSCRRKYCFKAPSSEAMKTWLDSLLDASELSVEDMYILRDQVATGYASKIHAGIDITTGLKVAIKIVEKNNLSANLKKGLMTELAVMQEVDHPNLLHIHEIFEKRDRLAIISERLTGGNLIDRIIQRGSFAETDAREVIRSLINTVSYLHSKGVMHRDIKLENLLYDSFSPDALLKLFDYGLCKFFTPGTKFTEACGKIQLLAITFFSSCTLSEI